MSQKLSSVDLWLISNKKKSAKDHLLNWMCFSLRNYKNIDILAERNFKYVLTTKTYVLS